MVKINRKQQALIDDYKAGNINTAQAKRALGTSDSMQTTPVVNQEKPVEPIQTPTPAPVTRDDKGALSTGFTPLKEDKPITPVTPTDTTKTKGKTNTNKNININIKDNKPTTPVKTEAEVFDPTIDPLGAQKNWKANGSNINDLEHLVEKKYGTVATIKDGVLTADINGQTYNWTVDENGDAVKTLVKQGEQTKTTNDYFMDLQNGVNITDKAILNSVDYKTAVERKSNLDQYSNMNVQELSGLMASGTLIPGTQEYNDLKLINPELVSQASKLSSLNSVNSSNKPNLTNSISDLITKYLTPQETTALSDSISTNPEVISLNSKLQEAQTKRDELLDQIDYAEEDVKADLGGKSVSKGYLNALVYERTKNLTRAANLAIADVNSYGAQLQNVTSNIKYDIQQQEELAKLNQAKFNTALNQYNTEITRKDKLDYQNQTLGINKYNAETSRINATNSQLNAYTNSTKPVVIGKDSNGNSVYGQSDGQGGYTPIYSGTNTTTQNFNGDYSTLDFSNNQELIKKYAGEASFKNNNPTGITWGVSDRLKGLWADAGINFTKGSDRPTKEGGSYIKFNSVGDGLNAYKVALTKGGTNDIASRLAQWKGTTDTNANNQYAQDIMAQSGVKPGAKFSDLNDDQLNVLMENQLKRESPKFYKELSNMQVSEPSSYDLGAVPLYKNFLSSGKLPTGVKVGSKEYEKIKQGSLKYQREITKQGTDQAKKLLGLIDDLYNLDMTDRALALTGGIPFTNSADNSATYDALISNNALDNLVKLKADGATFGALSNQELNFIKQSATKLKFTLSNEEWKKELDRMKKSLNYIKSNGEKLSRGQGRLQTTGGRL